MAALWLLLLDPTTYRDDITQWLSEALGREVAIQGRMYVAFYPWLGLQVEGVTIASAENQAGTRPHLATAKGAVIQLRMGALLKRQELELDNIVLIAPTLHLRRDADGRGNWEDVLALLQQPQDPSEADNNSIVTSPRASRVPPTGPAAHPPKTHPPGTPPHAREATSLEGAQWGKLRITDGTVHYADARSGHDVLLTRLHCLATRGESPAPAVSISLQGQVESSSLAASGDVEAEVILVMNSGDSFALTNGSLSLTGTMASPAALVQAEPANRPAAMAVAFASGVAYTAADNTLTLSKASLRAGLVNVYGNATILGLGTQKLAARGELSSISPPSSKSAVEEALETLETLTPEPLIPGKTIPQWQASFIFVEQRLEMPGFSLRISLEDTPLAISGSGAVAFGEQGDIASASFQLDAPFVDVDTLLAAGGTGSPLTEDDWDAILQSLAGGALPGLAQFQKQAPVDVSLSVERLRFVGDTIKDVSARIRLDEDGLSLQGSAGNYSGGPVSWRGALQQDTAKVHVDGKHIGLQRCALGTWLHKVTPFPPQGELFLSLTASAPSVSLEAWSRQWTFDGTVGISKGRVDLHRIEGWFGEQLPPMPDGKGEVGQLVVTGSLTRSPDSKPWDVVMTGDVALKASDLAMEPGQLVSGNASGKGGTSFNIKRGTLLSLSNLAVTTRAALPKGMLGVPAANAVLQTTISYERSDQRLALQQLALTAHGVRASGSLTMTKLGANPQMEGTISLPPTKAKALLAITGETPPPTEDPEALQEVAVSTSWQREGRQMRLTNLRLILDDTTMTGGASFTLSPEGLWGTPKNINFTLAGDKINMDRYLEPEEAPAQPGALPEPVTPWDASFMGDLSVSGMFTMQALTAFSLDFQDVAFQVDGKPGQLRIEPFTAKVAGGKLAASFALLQPRSGTEDVIGLDLLISGEINGFALYTVSQAFGGGDRVGGRTDITFNLHSRGATMAALRQQVIGDAAMSITNGYYAYTKAVTTTPPPPEQGLIKRTLPTPAPIVRQERAVINVSTATATFSIREGRVRNNDFRMHSDQFLATGHGWLDYIREEIDYVLMVDAKLIPPFPITFRGPLDNPVVDDSQGGSLAGAVGELTGTIFRTFVDAITLPFRALEGLAKQQRREQ